MPDVRTEFISFRGAPVSSVWMKAAVAGSIWASLEIIIGSFLHNLRVPFSGTILAVMSVYLLIAMIQIWDDRGVIWRAGLICALMKSVSPSAVILGPMTGILLEAILLETFIRILGRNLAGYLAGGAAAVLSSLVHKIATLIILYGFDLVKILADLYRFSVRQVNLENAKPAVVIGLIAGIYMVAGLAGAIGGYLAGKSYLKRRQPYAQNYVSGLNPAESLFAHTSGQKYSLIFLLLNLLFIAASLTLLNMAPLPVSLIFGASYALFVLVNYRNSINRLKKPGIWIQFALIALVSGLLWNSVTEGDIFNIEGLLAGLKMIWRAIIVILGFAAISVEMKNPIVKSVLYNRGLASLYQSLNLAFSALPSIISRLPSPVELLRNRGKAFGHLFMTAEGLLPLLETEHKRKPALFLITGDRLQGKTTFLKETTEIVRCSNINVSGFLSEAVHSDGVRTGFRITDIVTGNSADLCSINPQPGSVRQGRYWFSDYALKEGERIILSSIDAGSQLMVIDEVGPLELSGKGWYNAIEELTRRSSAVNVWTVRRSLAEKAARRWNVGTVMIIDIGNVTPEDTAELILHTLSRQEQ